MVKIDRRQIESSKCAYEAMILQEFISENKQSLEKRNEEISDRLFLIGLFTDKNYGKGMWNKSTNVW